MLNDAEDEEMYMIDCQPVNKSIDEIQLMPNISKSSKKDVSPSPPISFDDLKNSGWFQLFLTFIIFMMGFVIFYYLYTFSTGTVREMNKIVSRVNK